MLNMLLETVTIIGGESVTDLTIAEGLIYALLGFIVTFAGIVILIFLLWAISKIMAFARAKIAAGSGKKETTVSEPAAEGEIPSEVKAAIVAAIAAYYEGERSNCEFKVKRIKRL
ncbi:MAG TPA: OadG family protein [Candidatus Borkfalkia avistercoris]|uniref:OadG family protein n=1 Tax=Candidatus Borkfalkia avistercoris TaxID=2838504 RepID=A0A9D2CZ95_9FIRM|nr:OadG family protein [Candidatus Borkfalkia avistercoris]